MGHELQALFNDVVYCVPYKSNEVFQANVSFIWVKSKHGDLISIFSSWSHTAMSQDYIVQGISILPFKPIIAIVVDI